jgi:uncharacterized protein
MKLHLATGAGRNQFTGYGDGYVAINNQRYERAVVVTPDAVHDAWNVATFDDIQATHLQFVLSLSPEIVILGTGAQQRFPRVELMRELATARVGFEFMETRAACRTYNILMSEGRAVAAAVLML